MFYAQQADDGESGTQQKATDGRRKRSDASNLRKKEFGTKHSNLDKTKVHT